MTTLFDYEEATPPALKPTPRRELPVPNPRMYGTAGVVGLLDRDGSPAYVSQRIEEDHLFRKYDGYAVSDTILGFLRNRNVRTVIVAVMDTGYAYEFDLSDFDDHGIPTNEEDDDPQTCVPKTFARWGWEGHAAFVL